MGANKETRGQDREKIKELEQQKKQMQEELDELKGETPKAKALGVVVFLLVIGILFGILLALIKMDVGGFASETLAPLIGDVPVVRSILPKDLQRPSQNEIAASEQQQADSEAAAASEAAASEAAAQEAADSEATAASEQAVSEEAASEAAASEAAASEEAASEAAAEQALVDYVKTYSSMKPKDAAAVFDGMMPDGMKLVVKILENMTAQQRSDILSKMNTQNASDITVEMDKELP